MLILFLIFNFRIFCLAKLNNLALILNLKLFFTDYSRRGQILNKPLSARNIKTYGHQIW